MKVTKRTIERARNGLQRVSEKVDEMKNHRKEELEQEYEKLVAGLRRAREAEDAGLGGPPVLPKDLLDSAIPGSIRKADNFVGWLKRLVEYCSSRLRVQLTVQESPLSFLRDLKQKVNFILHFTHWFTIIFEFHRV